FLQALNTDLADRALALKLLVAIQMEAQEFDKALSTAHQATRTAQGLSASLRQKLDDTRRDVRSVDWHGDMPDWLATVLEQLDDQLARDRQLRELATRAGEDPEAAPVCRAIVEEVKRGEDVWIRLERHLARAIPVFLQAQQAQRFHPRGPATVFDLTDDVLFPFLRASDHLTEAVTGELVTGGFAPHVEPQWGLEELCAPLLRAHAYREIQETVCDLPGELGDEIGDSIPEELAATAEKIIIKASTTPTRLSGLIEEARRRTAEPTTRDRLTDIMWGAVHYAFVAGGEATSDELPSRASLAAALSRLVAIADEKLLDDPRYLGPDLLLATPADLDRLDNADPEGTM
ncbi:MAG TPA: hypothetical protein VMF13_08635, partial [Luteitalea sp.]|nr:hypothetical protein [Luteitalea sp.]